MRRALIVAGSLVMAYAVAGALLDPDVRVLGVLIFLAIVLVAHDGVLLPAVIGVGALIGRLPEPAPVRVAAIGSVAVTLVGLPSVAGNAGVPASRLLLVLGAVWATAAVWTAVLRIRKHPERSSAAPPR